MKNKKIIYSILFCFLLLGGCAKNTVESDNVEPSREENMLEKEDNVSSPTPAGVQEVSVTPTVAETVEPTLTMASTATTTPTPTPIAVLEHPYVGKIVEFGSYEQDNNIENGKEKIEWIVLDVQNDAALLLSKYCLDYRDYYFEKSSETWLGSGMQKWLGTEFKENAFSPEEESYIVPVHLKTRDYTEYASTDEVFLLSVFEVDRYFVEREAKIACATNYASSKYPYTESPEGDNILGTSWYTRTKGNGSDLLTFVSGTGKCYGGAPTGELCGVRPAVWVDISSLKLDVIEEFGFKLKNEYLWKATPAEYFRYSFEEEGELFIAGVSECANFETLIVPDVIAGYSVDVLRGLRNPYVKEIRIPGSVYIIYGGTFSNCPQLEKITISTELGPRFYEKGGLLYSDNRGGELTAVPVNYEMRKYIVPEDVYTIADGAFENCLYVEEVVIPEHVKLLQAEAFIRCPSLKEVEIQGANTELRSEIFKECENLVKVSLPDGLKEIPYSMFAWCKNLKEVNFPVGLEQIASCAFEGCISLESISLPEGLLTLEGWAFDGCKNLKTIYLPESYFGAIDNPFVSCRNIETVYYAGTKEQWKNVIGKEYFGEAQIICKDGVYE